jgi:hypothetical protein
VSGPLVIGPDDLLELYPGSSDARLIPYSQICFSLRLLHADGRIETVDRTNATVQVTVTNTAVVQGPADDSCPTGAAVVGLAPGASTVRVQVTDSNGVSVVGGTLVRVQQGMFQVSPVSSRVVLLGGERLLALAGYTLGSADGYLFSYSIQTTPSTDRAYMVPSWLRPTNSHPSVVTLERAAGLPAFRVLGLAAGAAQVGFEYEPPGGAPITVPPGEIQVVDTFTVSSVGSIQLEEGLRVFTSLDSRQVPPGCYDLWALANVTAGGAQESMRLSGAMDWSLLGGVGAITPGNVTRYCATESGDAVVRACRTGVCRVGAWPVFPHGDIETVALEPPSLSVTLQSLTRVCLDVRAVATLRGGGTRDVTTSPATRWDSEGGGQSLWRELDLEGLPVQDAMGRPCFFPTMLGLSYGLTARYGDTSGSATVAVMRAP